MSNSQFILALLMTDVKGKIHLKKEERERERKKKNSYL